MGRAGGRRAGALLGFALVASAGTTSGRASAPPAETSPRLLVATVTKGYRHASIPAAEALLGRLARESGGFALDHARTDEELAAKTTAEALAGYAAVVFANTSGDLPVASPQGLVDWLAGGGAFVGFHSASDTFHGFPAFLEALGGEFDRHGKQARVDLLVQDRDHPATAGLSPSFEVFDEIYLFERFDRGRVHMLLALDSHPNTGRPGYYPLAWTRAHGRGRVFYTALGHREDVIESGWFARHLLGGIRWALDRKSSSGR